MKSTKEEIAFIHTLLPSVDSAKIEYVDTGWTSRVYLVDDGEYVVKFPRSNATREEYNHEIKALQLLGKINSRVLVPHIIKTHPRNDYVIYRGIIGNSLDALPHDIDDETANSIGSDLGNFLQQLHGMELEGARVMGIEDEITQFQQKYEKGKSVLVSLLNDTQRRQVETLVYSILPSELRRLGYTRALCHGDLGYWNLILSEANQVGVIDFGDIGFWDISKDFIGMESQTMLDAALRVYGDSDTLRQKIVARRKVLVFLDLPYYAEKNDQKGLIKTIQRIKETISTIPDPN